MCRKRLIKRTMAIFLALAMLCGLIPGISSGIQKAYAASQYIYISNVTVTSLDTTQTPSVAKIEVTMPDIGLDANSITITNNTVPGAQASLTNVLYSTDRYILTVNGMKYEDTYTLKITKQGYYQYVNKEVCYGVPIAASELDLVHELNIFDTYNREYSAPGTVTIRNDTYTAGTVITSPSAIYTQIDGNNNHPDNGTITRVVGIFVKAPGGAKGVKTLRTDGQMLQVTEDSLIDANTNYQETVKDGKDYYNEHKNDDGFVDNEYWKTISFLPLYSHVVTARQEDGSRILVDPDDRFRIIEWYGNEACTGPAIKVQRLNVKVEYKGTVQLNHGGVITTYSSIQSAVNASADDDTVYVGAGTFREQLTITKNITLQGTGIDQTIIEAPDSSVLTQTGGNWKNLKNQDVFAVIGVKAGGQVNIKNLTVNGRDQGYLPDITYGDKMAYTFQGIGIYNTNADIDSVKVTRVRELASDYTGNNTPGGYLPVDQPSGMNHNEAIFAESAEGSGPNTVTIQNSIVTKFQKSGILAWGPTLIVNIHDNLIQGYGQTFSSTGNGMQIASSDLPSGDRRGTSGEVRNNRVLDIGLVVPPPGQPGSELKGKDYDGPSGILLYYAADNFRVIGNTVMRTYTPSWHINAISKDNKGYTNYGINIVSGSNPVISNNTVSGYDIGIIEGDSSSGSLLTAEGNNLSSNGIDIWTAGGDDQINLADGNVTVGYNQINNGLDTITNFGPGDAIYVIGFTDGSVNGLIGTDPVSLMDTGNELTINSYNDAHPVVDFTNGTVIEGDGTNVAAHSVQTAVTGSSVLLYIDTDGNSGAAELTVKLNGNYGPSNFRLSGGYIYYVSTITLTATPGNGCTNLSWNSVAGAASYKIYKNGSYLATVAANVNAYDVANLTNGTAYSFQIKAFNSGDEVIGASGQVSATPYRPSSGGDTVSNTAEEDIVATVNDKKDNLGTAKTEKEGDKTVTTVTLDDKKLDQKLAEEGMKAVVTIPVKKGSDVVVGKLTGQTVKNMETKEAVLEIKTENVTYTLPAAQINIDEVSSEIGQQVELKDIKVNVKIAEPTQDTVKIVEDTANKNGCQVVVKPVEFEITCSGGNKTVEVSKFNGYVKRTVAIPDGIDPSKITTGIVLNKDGTFSHVPTAIIIIDGKYYAKINSLTNSTYSVVWNPKTFKDVEKHWAKDAVNDMGSRMVMDGIEEDKFSPDIAITRGEFTDAVVRGLGLLRTDKKTDRFKDVAGGSKYMASIAAAVEYGIIGGYKDGTFRPDRQITREEAMNILLRAMNVAGLDTQIKDEEIKAQLAKFKDGTKVNKIAAKAAAICAKYEIFAGGNAKNLSPKENITKAQTAAVIKRLLAEAKLI